MKIRNLLLTAALFLTAGIVSAKTFNLNDINQETRTDYDWSITNYQEGKYSLSATVIRYDDSDAWTYTAYTASKEWSLAVDIIEENDEVVNVVSAGTAKLVNYNLSYDADGNITQGVYYFALPYEQYDKQGVPADTTIAVKVGDTADSLENDNGLFYKVTPTEKKYLAYNMNADTGKPEAEIAFGQPLPTPVITLLIALGLGAAFVMYRNRKQQVKA